METLKIEERLESLESEVSRLGDEVVELRSVPKKDWKSVVGIGEENALGHEAARLGRAWRVSESNESDR